jgi:hypothetical protein
VVPVKLATEIGFALVGLGVVLFLAWVILPA